MKKIFTTIAISILTAASVHAVGITIVAPAQIKLTALTQGEDFALQRSKTNTTATSTNTTFVFKSTVIKTAFSNSNLLALLANSFNTNFPAGAQIGLSFAHIYVVDSTGTNILFNPGTVISFNLDEDFSSGVETDIFTQNSSGTSVTGNDTMLVTASASLNYDDSLQTTHDGTHTTFQFKGLMTVKESVNFKTAVSKDDIEFEGTGGGSIRNVQTILNGTIKAKPTGIEPI
jgi:hypothetical protein